MSTESKLVRFIGGPMQGRTITLRKGGRLPMYVGDTGMTISTRQGDLQMKAQTLGKATRHYTRSVDDQGLCYVYIPIWRAWHTAGENPDTAAEFMGNLNQLGAASQPQGRVTN